ncbi:pilus assembly protein TadG-related protein [Histidinibacterium lentulum]|uniref:Putative Flp pilus-assembly TadG-like N-terminal domain-containing protein n=1 Tax=Histidinibacterium lentulum TaxID=2480588 RepID=A0A3N2R7C6_9RHOB|nr:vWA domain-containing protein [Histidinibacterium lentulum]ROU03354.1 hypothetical protein EAT49_03330 [Histidinibacterium lentulum]
MAVRMRSMSVGAVAGFRSREDGGFAIFSLFLFIAMMAVTGMAVDLMRLETQRTRLQATLDRAALAAADLDQTLDPRAVAEDYLDRAGLSHQLLSVAVEEGLNFRTVTLEGKVDMGGPFFNILNTANMIQPASATATERVDNLEISLVVDISASMGGSKLTELKNAATAFVNTIFAKAEWGDVTISLVPYSTQVALPAEMADLYAGFNRIHGYTSCVDFNASDFTTTAISPAANNPLRQSQHFDPFATWGELDSSNERLFVCPEGSQAEILPYADNAAALLTAISQLEIESNTSIDIGMKWGAAMLDPSFGPVLDGLIAEGTVDAGFSDRPFAFDDDEAIKVIVLMTDGENTTEFRVDDSLRGMSNIYRENNGEIWVHATEHRRNGTDGDNNHHERWFNSKRERYGWSNFWRYTWHFSQSWNLGYDDIPREFTRLSWAEVFDFTSLYYNAWYYQYAREWNANDFWRHRDWAYQNVSGSEKDSRLAAICNASKAQGIIIYAVGFEVSNHAANVMGQCASSPAHFFRVAGAELTQAFNAIARNITDLRLTQ